MVWRGVLHTSSDREVLMKTTENHPDVADVTDVHWGSGIPASYLSATDFCRYAYIIYTEGNSSELARLNFRCLLQRAPEV